MKKTLLFLIIIVTTLLSCSDDDETVTINETIKDINNTTTKTEANISVLNTKSEGLNGYTVIMFETKPEIDQPLPDIVLEVVSNSNGLAQFDLEAYITSKKTIYFQAFLKQGDNYIWKGINTLEKEISPGQKWTTSILISE